jgi:hypothetical protein
MVWVNAVLYSAGWLTGSKVAIAALGWFMILVHQISDQVFSDLLDVLRKGRVGLGPGSALMKRIPLLRNIILGTFSVFAIIFVGLIIWEAVDTYDQLLTWFYVLGVVSFFVFEYYQQTQAQMWILGLVFGAAPVLLILDRWFGGYFWSWLTLFWSWISNVLEWIM